MSEIVDHSSEYARGFKAGHEATLRKNPSGCVCKFDEDDNLVEMCAAHKRILEERLAALEKKLKAER